MTSGNSPAELDTAACGTWPAWFGTVSAICTAFLVIPIITYISTKVGKKNAFVISTAISIVGYSIAALFMFGIVSLVALGIKLFA